MSRATSSFSARHPPRVKLFVSVNECLPLTITKAVHAGRPERLDKQLHPELDDLGSGLEVELDAVSTELLVRVVNPKELRLFWSAASTLDRGAPWPWDPRTFSLEMRDSRFAWPQGKCLGIEAVHSNSEYLLRYEIEGPERIQPPETRHTAAESRAVPPSTAVRGGLGPRKARPPSTPPTAQRGPAPPPAQKPWAAAAAVAPQVHQAASTPPRPATAAPVTVALRQLPHRDQRTLWEFLIVPIILAVLILAAAVAIEIVLNLLE